MKSTMNRIGILSIFILLLIINIIPSFSSIGNDERYAYLDTFDGYIDLDVSEVWDLLNTTENGVQYPIDVRSDSEWISEHIQTPYPEYARHHNKAEWEDELVLQQFMELYQGKEIILYCKSGGRSTSAANTLVQNGFIGTIYNMVGGITEWKANGYPTINNRAPENPQISGPHDGIPGEEYYFNFESSDPDYDTIDYEIRWGDGTITYSSEAIPSGEQVIFSHVWESVGWYTIEVKAKDTYAAESAWTPYNINISFTELAIDSIDNGFGKVTVTIRNIGEYIAKNLSVTLQINGGILSRININQSCNGCDDCESSLEAGGIKILNSTESGYIFGFGPITVFVVADADNAEQITITKQYFVIGPILL